jgi:hypothetical protein
MSKLTDVRDEVQRKLIEDFDASPDLAEDAASKITDDDLEEHPDIDELTEYVHDTQSFWED